MLDSLRTAQRLLLLLLAEIEHAKCQTVQLIRAGD